MVNKRPLRAMIFVCYTFDKRLTILHNLFLFKLFLVANQAFLVLQAFRCELLNHLDSTYCLFSPAR